MIVMPDLASLAVFVDVSEQNRVTSCSVPATPRTTVMTTAPNKPFHVTPGVAPFRSLGPSQVNGGIMRMIAQAYFE